MKKLLFIVFLLVPLVNRAQQVDDSIFLSKIFNTALSERIIMKHLKHLCDTAPGRLMGSKQSEIAVKYLKSLMEELHPDTCFLLEYETIGWKPVSTTASVFYNGRKINLNVLALGPSVSTPSKGIEAEVIEVASVDDLQKIGEGTIKGKIVFINKVMSDTIVNPSLAYRDAVKGRSIGAIEAARFGAKATIVRSVSQALDTFPHTGKTNYVDSINKIPIIAISTIDAEKLHYMLDSNKKLTIKLVVSSEILPKIKACNIIADIKGKEKPEDYILFGAHVDSWYNTPGAHDDGAGCVQVIEAMRIFKALSYNNKHSLRFVLYMDEELSQTGGEVYYKYAQENRINHIVAIESDAGGLAPRAFAVDATDSVFNKINKYCKQLLPYGIYSIYKGGTDVDIEPLKKLSISLIGNKPNTHRYFDYHHSAFDTFDKVNFRELQFSTTNQVGIIYLIDKYGL